MNESLSDADEIRRFVHSLKVLAQTGDSEPNDTLSMAAWTIESLNDRIAGANATLDRVAKLCDRWESAPHAFWHSASEKLREVLTAPAQKEAPVVSQLCQRAEHSWCMNRDETETHCACACHQPPRDSAERMAASREHCLKCPACDGDNHHAPEECPLTMPAQPDAQQEARERAIEGDYPRLDTTPKFRHPSGCVTGWFQGGSIAYLAGSLVALIVLCSVVVIAYEKAKHSSVWQPQKILTKLCMLVGAEDVLVSDDAPNVQSPISSSLDIENVGIVIKVLDGGIHDEVLVWPKGSGTYNLFFERKSKVARQGDRQNASSGSIADIFGGRLSRIQNSWPRLESKILSSFLIGSGIYEDGEIRTHLLSRALSNGSDIIGEMYGDLFHRICCSSGLGYGLLHRNRLSRSSVEHSLSCPPQSNREESDHYACKSADRTIVGLDERSGALKAQRDRESGLLFFLGLGGIGLLYFVNAILKRL